MRLVIDGRRLTAERTGVGRYLELLLQDWATSGAPLPETLIVLRDRGGLSRVPLGSGMQSEVVGEGWPGLLWERFGLCRKLREGDILFAPANLVPWGWRGKTVLAMHDTLQEVLPESFAWRLRWRFARRYRQSAAVADRVLTLSQSTWRDVSKFYGVPASRLRVVYPAPDPAFRPQGPASEEVAEARGRVGLGSAPFFLFVGKASRRRNLPAILEAFERHRDRHPDHRLVFVGPGEFEGGSKGDHPSIIRAGHVPESVLRGLLADAVALLYPSEYEGFGLPIIEAMASGCPVITLRRPPLLEAGGDAAWYLDHAEPEALANAMHVLATDIAARASRMARGFSQASKFHQSRFADEVKAEIRDVAGYRQAGKGPKLRPGSRRRLDREPRRGN
jgi:glycosyltransferase involved in cell wall biosynthesis